MRPAEVKGITIRRHVRFKRSIAGRKSRRGWICPVAVDQVRFINDVLTTIHPARKVELGSIGRKSTGKVHGGGDRDDPRRKDLRRQTGGSLSQISVAACAIECGQPGRGPILRWRFRQAGWLAAIGVHDIDFVVSIAVR